jgi:hypothetical protein
MKASDYQIRHSLNLTALPWEVFDETGTLATFRDQDSAEKYTWTLPRKDFTLGKFEVVVEGLPRDMPLLVVSTRARVRWMDPDDHGEHVREVTVRDGSVVVWT